MAIDTSPKEVSAAIKKIIFNQKIDRPTIWQRLKAYFRTDLELVCRLSNEKNDYHDYPDDVYGQPIHFFALTCKRCGKAFTI
jgi:hypothetical protein